MPLFIGFLIVTACNAAWLFGIALPGHPAAAFPEPPPVTAASAIIDRYDIAIDNDELSNADRNSAIDTAAAIEASVVGAIVAVVLARRIT